jgi:hypothetical protein
MRPGRMSARGDAVENFLTAKMPNSKGKIS